MLLLLGDDDWEGLMCCITVSQLGEYTLCGRKSISMTEGYDGAPEWICCEWKREENAPLATPGPGGKRME